MKTEFLSTPRLFDGGGNPIQDQGKIHLEPYEMVSFVNPSGGECDFYAMPWGFYLGPSLNARLKRQGFKTALVINKSGQIYVNAVASDKMDEFLAYIRQNSQESRILTWLDEWMREEA